MAHLEIRNNVFDCAVCHTPCNSQSARQNIFDINNSWGEKAEEILKRYPKKNKKSAVMPFLYLAQKQNDNWIPLAAMKYIANYLSMPYISVYEVATFYTMYNLAPVGKY